MTARARRRGLRRRVLPTIVGAIGLGLVVVFPTLLICAGVALLGYDYDWWSWRTYAGITVLALTLLVSKMLRSDSRNGALLEAIFRFPKR